MVLDQRIIDIIDRDHNAHGRTVCPWHILLDILDLGHQNTRQTLLQDIICCNLQVLINGQIQIMPGFWLSLALHLQHISHTVHIDGTLPLLTLKICLHILLQTCFTNQVIGIIIFILFFQRIQLILVRLANISNDICKIFRIGIRTQTALLNIHSLQITLVLQDLCNCGI